MPALRDLQLDFGRALLGGPTDGVTAVIAEDGVPAAGRFAIYHHHVLATLTTALQSVYPVVCRLVDERFFGHVADRFIRRHPPAGPCLAEYGAAFPAFLADFPACRHLAYLPDVARLEWAIHLARHAEDAVPLISTALADIDPERVGDLAFRFDPALALVASQWPVEAIWRANQMVGDVDAVDLAAGGAWLQVHRHDDDVVVQALTPAAYAFRRALADGRRLADAVASAAGDDPAFDLVEALHALFREHVLTGFTLSPPAKERS